MKFRKLYWVTEQLSSDGTSEVVGVFTSVYDLRAKGLRWDEGVARRDGFRLSLVKLDSLSKPLGVWTSPDFAGLRAALQEYVDSGEFDGTSCDHLVEDLAKFASAAAKSA